MSMEFPLESNRETESHGWKEQAFDGVECVLRFDVSLHRRLTGVDSYDSPRRSRVAHGLVGPVERAAQAADEMITGNSCGVPGRYGPG
jgi:hypothetical protein